MRKDNELLRYINIANELERKRALKRKLEHSLIGAFSGAIAAGIVILIFK
jgi:hypothetical protein